MPGNKHRSLRILGALAIVLSIAIALGAWQGRRIWLGPAGAAFDSEGISIHYTDEGKGIPVVLVHGLAFTGNLEWRNVGIVDALLPTYRVITMDVRGHGQSDKPHDPAQYGLQMVEDVVRLLDHLKIEKAHVVGLSMGGFITLKLTVVHPERLLSASICAAGWQDLSTQNLAFGEAVAGALERGEGIGPLAGKLGITGTLERFGVRLGVNYFNDPIALAAVLRGFPGLAVSEAALRANAVPALTIIGSEDGFLPDARALNARMSNHTLVVVEGKNHMNIPTADAFLPALQRFLAEHTPVAESPR